MGAERSEAPGRPRQRAKYLSWRATPCPLGRGTQTGYKSANGINKPASSMRHLPAPLGLPLILGLTLAACTAPAGPPAPGHETILITTPGEGPPDARPGACYGKDVTPAVVEVVTEQVLVEPAQFSDDGTIIKPATYQTSTHQAIVEPRKEFFFEVPCPDQFTPEFITSLQRALKARGLYRGRLSGVMDERTRRAIRKFQIPRGLNSDILTTTSALELGLLAYGRDAL